MGRVFDITHECGCMETSDPDDPAMIPCGAGYWEMTPEKYRGEKPLNYDIHIKCMEKLYQAKQDREREEDTQTTVCETHNILITRNAAGEIFIEDKLSETEIRIVVDNGLRITSERYPQYFFPETYENMNCIRIKRIEQ